MRRGKGEEEEEEEGAEVHCTTHHEVQSLVWRSLTVGVREGREERRDSTMLPTCPT